MINLICRNEYFYQVILFNFGCFYSIQLEDDSINIRELLLAAMDLKKEENKIDDYLQLLEEFAPMLEDYFSITIIKNTNNELVLKALPRITSSYEPYYGYLPRFLYQLVKMVNFTDEKKCLEGVAREIAHFYSFIPDSSSVEEMEHWRDAIQSVLYPQIKRQLIVNDRLWNQGIIQLIASTDRLYRVFERC